MKEEMEREKGRVESKKGRGQRAKGLQQEPRTNRPRMSQKPREHMTKMASLYRTQKLGREAKPRCCTGEL